MPSIRLNTQKQIIPELWRSPDHLAGGEEFQQALQQEFPKEAAEWARNLSRRHFLTIMGAAFAAGATACSRQPVEKLVPYVNQPPELVPGNPLFFASAQVLGGFARGVLVESHEGRPTKIEGNPNHPASLGATDVFMQAAVLQLYDPDRSQAALEKGLPSNWEAFLSALLSESRRWGNGSGLAFITGAVTSPTLCDQFQRIANRYPAARWVIHEPAARVENSSMHYNLEQAEVILSIDADFLGWGPRVVADSMAFAKRRNPSKTMNRLYVVESAPSLTGAMADHRFVMTPSEIAQLPAQLLAEIHGAPNPHSPPWLSALVKDLQSHTGRNLILAGEFLPNFLRREIIQLNNEFGNEEAYLAESFVYSGNQTLADLTNEMSKGKIQAAFLLDCNPVYSAPADIPFAKALQRVPFSVHQGLFVDETAAICRWHLPMVHFLEGWSDALAFEGTPSVIQPLILPLYNGISPHVLAAALLGEWPANDYEIVRDFWRQQLTSGDFETLWRLGVHDGVMPGDFKIAHEASVPFVPSEIPSGNNPEAYASSGLHLIIRPDPHIYDGRYANNPWLQELPKPLTKIVWENAAHIAPSTAEGLGISHGEEVDLVYRNHVIRAPIWILPGMASNCVQVTLGYGRERAGKVGSNRGFNAYALRTSDAPWGGPGLEIRKTGDIHHFATTQEHGAMEGRHLIRFADLKTFEATKNFAVKEGHPPAPDETLYPQYAYEGHAWGMAIDLNVCTGCSVCTIACQAENNIPVVGPEQVKMSREMHWIRVDRYFNGPLENPGILHQPVPCMHCEKAPCEVVCPVAATVHDSEGLNAMVYNRCIGTRYCSNNCPYKVRRFNFLNYVQEPSPTRKLQYNPDVTVRSLGVMEKCTYCLQRINRVRIQAQNEDRPLRDGEIVPACAQACPTQAITFGDINDHNSRVAQKKAESRNYGLLAELNTRPRTTYLARIYHLNTEI